VALTTKLLVEMTTICALDELDDDELALDAEELADGEALLLGLLLDPVEAGELDEEAEPEPEPEPEPELLEVPATCWPTLRLTEATVPVMVEVSEALSRLVWSDVSWDCAEVTDAWSEAIWLAEALADWSLASLAWAEVNEACAELTVAWRADGSTVASV